MTLGEIRLFAYHKNPDGWMLCDGRALQVRSYQALYSIIGNTYGGDGVKDFNLPDLRGVTPIHQNTNKEGSKKDLPVGTRGGSATESLTVAALPRHLHTLHASTASATIASPANFLASKPTASASSPAVHPIYAEAKETELVTLAHKSISIAGASAGHENMQPYIALNYCIAVKGDYPPRPE